jgi:hypothetical protein
MGFVGLALSKQFNEPEARMLVHRSVWQANFAPIPILPAGKKGRERHGKGVWQGIHRIQKKDKDVHTLFRIE